MIKKWNNFMFESNEEVLLYYAFDWDDNILNMPTVIHMDKLVDGEWVPEDVSTSRFAEVRSDVENWRIINNDPDAAFSEFRDNGPRGDVAFLEDTKLAINNGNFGPAWSDFIECLVTGALFAIITARGHEAPGIRKGVEYIIDNVLTDDEKQLMYDHLLKFVYKFKSGNIDSMSRILRGVASENELVKLYLDNCEYVGVSSPSRSGSSSNPEKAKEEAFLEFSKKVNSFAGNLGMKGKIGFSDDDNKNYEHIEGVINNLHHEEFSNIKSMVVKNTNNPEDVTKSVRSFESIKTFKEFNESQDPMASSTISMRTPNAAMSGEMDSLNPFVKQKKIQTDVIDKITKDVVDDVNKKRKKRNRNKK